jgi:hypothetical protein
MRGATYNFGYYFKFTPIESIQFYLLFDGILIIWTMLAMCDVSEIAHITSQRMRCAGRMRRCSLRVWCHGLSCPQHSQYFFTHTALFNLQVMGGSCISPIGSIYTHAPFDSPFPFLHSKHNHSVIPAHSPADFASSGNPMKNTHAIPIAATTSIT